MDYDEDPPPLCRDCEGWKRHADKQKARIEGLQREIQGIRESYERQMSAVLEKPAREEVHRVVELERRLGSDLVEKVAEAIYRNVGGVSPDEFEAVIGQPQRHWKTDAPWDTDPNELCEHERDEYRFQARAILNLFGIVTDE